jgi:pimeloyl-ACP methyl ester carboxylesterase
VIRDLWSLLLLFPLLTGCLSFHKGPMPGEPQSARFAEIDGVRVRYIDTGEPEGAPASPAPARSDNDANANANANSSAAPVATAGVKPTVVLVHGFASAIEAWAGVVPALVATHRVIALDLKGFGWTDRPPGDYSPEAQAKLVFRLLDLRGVSRTAIVAHSWGSSVALAATLKAPERVTKLALYDAWVYEEQLPTFFHWARAEGVGEALFGLFYKQRVDERIGLAFFDKRYVTEQLVESVEEAVDRPGTVAAALAAVRDQDYSFPQRRYSKIDKPTLLMWGREDIVTPLQYGERLSRDLPSSKLVVYPRCGHFPMIEALAASNRDLVQFLTDGRADTKSDARPDGKTEAKLESRP